MRVPMKWLSEFVEVKVPVERLVDVLENTGTAVAALHKIGADLEGVVVGLITAKERHPDADKLWVTMVDVGGEAELQIVCGAQNFSVGDRVPVAVPGVVLPNGQTIKKAKIRGIESSGMNCSASELGIGQDQDGILILPHDAPVGTAFSDYYAQSDFVLELEITPNRPDCLSVIGVAREVAAALDLPFQAPASTQSENILGESEPVHIEIVDFDLCPRYCAALVRGVKVGPSPEWLEQRLTAVGVRPINNVVDITNYVMFEMGQPLHAFDLEKLSRPDGRPRIIVRRAANGERLKTLDGVERKLTDDMLVICDPAGPIALAGVMGGEATEVSGTTVDVLLESAAFDPVSISKTSRTLNLLSEASTRFERGVDSSACLAVLSRAAQLMAEVCGGEIHLGLSDAHPKVSPARRIDLRERQLHRITGAGISLTEAAQILEKLGLTVEIGPGVLHAQIPSFRPDLSREIDLVEEILRLWGMERVSPTLPKGRGRLGRLTPFQEWRERAGATLRASGLNETMTYVFCDPRDLESVRFELPPGEVPVKLLNPMSEEQAVLRRLLLPGLLRSVSYNQRRGVTGVQLYEIANIFISAEGRQLPKEREVVGAVLAGQWQPPAWHDQKITGGTGKAQTGCDLPSGGAALGFFDGKGVIETLTMDMGTESVSFRAAQIAWLQPGRSAEVVVGSDVVGWLGEVHPKVLATFECNGPVVAFELSLAALIKQARSVKRYKGIPKFPAIEIDVALVVPVTQSAESIRQAIASSAGSLLESVRLFDVFSGYNVQPGYKSLAFSLSYRSADRTLTEEEVRPVHDRMLRKVEKAVGAKLRGA